MEELTEKKILFISTQLPYPPKSGGTVKSWNYLNHLVANYAVTLACLLKDEDESHLASFLNAITLKGLITENLNIGRSPVNLIKSYFFAPCLNVFRNASSSFKKRVEVSCHEQDILIIDHYEMFQYVPPSYAGKVIMHTHNAEFVLWQRMGEISINPLKKLVLQLEAKRVKNYEKKIFERSDLVYATPSDIELYRNASFPTEHLHLTYHLGNDQLLQLPDLQFNETELALTFIGTLSWEPNIDGIIWFIQEVWPSILQQYPNCKLYILGKEPVQRILDAAQNDAQIIFTGFIKNLEEYLNKTRVYIAPLRFGSGMKVKVLEGLYRGVPTVTTTVGAEGLEVSSGQELFIADQADLFAAHCLSLLEDQNLWNNMRDLSRKKGKEKYQWKSIFEEMNKQLKAIL